MKFGLYAKEKGIEIHWIKRNLGDRIQLFLTAKNVVKLLTKNDFFDNLFLKDEKRNLRRAMKALIDDESIDDWHMLVGDSNQETYYSLALVMMYYQKRSGNAFFSYEYDFRR